jgi:uncharacterized phage protein gp47/JayE
MVTNVPRPAFGPRGFVAPSEEDILEGVLEDFQLAFGGGLNPALETPQGQLATTEAAIIGNTDDTFCFFTNQVDPAFSQGRMQDAIGRIYFIARIPALPTTVQAQCIGLPGVVIPKGSLARAADGNIYISQDSGTIDSTGSVLIFFYCQTAGPIACPTDTLNQIYRAIPGWDTINNPTDGVVGVNVESRAAFEARRAASVAVNAIGSLPSVLGAVLAVPGILDAYVTENVLSTSLGIGAVTLAPHSLYVAAEGGSDQDVAHAIWTKKSPGCDYNGNTTVVVQDTRSGYSVPYPSYNVKFTRPTPLAIHFRVTITNSAQVPSNATALIQSAIQSAFNGEDGGSRARIGATIYSTRYYAPVSQLGSWALIVSITVGTAPAPTASTVSVEINQIPTLNVNDIEVTLI